jgi:hypothetical protein
VRWVTCSLTFASTRCDSTQGWGWPFAVASLN